MTLTWTCDRCDVEITADPPALWHHVGAHYATHPLRRPYRRRHSGVSTATVIPLPRSSQDG